MSGSNKKKEKSSSPEEAMKKQRSMRLEAEEKKKETINTVIGGCVAVVILSLALWNQGLFRNDTAFSINGQDFSYQQVQMKYTDGLYAALMGQYTPEEGGTSYDMSTPSEEQMYSSTETWHDYFSKQACISLAKEFTIYQMAIADGFTLPAEALESLEETKAYLDTAWVGKTTSKSAYFNSMGVSEADYLKMEEYSLYSGFYQNSIYDGFTYSDEEMEEYYQENQDTLDIITYSQLQYLHIQETSEDEDGNEVELTEEEEAYFTGLRTLVMIEADSALEALEEGSSLEEVQELYGNYISSATLNETTPSMSISSTTDVGAWLLDGTRTVGDITKLEETTDTGTSYTILVFEGRERAEEVTADVRHILINAEADEEGNISDEAWDTAESRANDILALFLDEGAKVEDFISMAAEFSGDSATAAYGGLMEAVTTYDNYTPEMLEWMTDTSREPGDTTIVKDESTVNGWQILYFDGWADSIWQISTKYALGTERMNQWTEENTGDIENQITYEKALSSLYAASLFG